MVRVGALSILLVILTMAPATHALALRATLAQGDATWDYDRTDGTGCTITTRFVVKWDGVTNQMFIEAATPGCPITDYRTTLNNCRPDAASTIRCDRSGPTFHVWANLTATGHFELRWFDPTFEETIVGQLDRRDA